MRVWAQLLVFGARHGAEATLYARGWQKFGQLEVG